MFAQAINTVSEFWQLYKGVERKWDKTNYQAEKVKKRQSSQDIPNFVKDYFFLGHLRKIRIKDRNGEMFCFNRRKILPESRDSCNLIKRVIQCMFKSMFIRWRNKSPSQIINYLIFIIKYFTFLSF